MSSSRTVSTIARQSPLRPSTEATDGDIVSPLRALVMAQCQRSLAMGVPGVDTSDDWPRVHKGHGRRRERAHTLGVAPGVRETTPRAASGSVSQSWDARVSGPAATWWFAAWWCAAVVVPRLCRQGLYRPSRRSDRPDQGRIPPVACPRCMAPRGLSVDRCAGGMDPRGTWPVHARGAWIARHVPGMTREVWGSSRRGTWTVRHVPGMTAPPWADALIDTPWARRATAPHRAAVGAGQPDDVSPTPGTTGTWGSRCR